MAPLKGHCEARNLRFRQPNAYRGEVPSATPPPLASPERGGAERSEAEGFPRLHPRFLFAVTKLLLCAPHLLFDLARKEDGPRPGQKKSALNAGNSVQCVRSYTRISNVVHFRVQEPCRIAATSAALLWYRIPSRVQERGEIPVRSTVERQRYAWN